jgi:hypothetical protein
MMMGRPPSPSHGSRSHGARRRAGSTARIATVVAAGVQWGGPGLARPRVDRPASLSHGERRSVARRGVPGAAAARAGPPAGRADLGDTGLRAVSQPVRSSPAGVSGGQSLTGH